MRHFHGKELALGSIVIFRGFRRKVCFFGIAWSKGIWGRGSGLLLQSPAQLNEISLGISGKTYFGEFREL